jgi:hypothetical protein
MTYSMYREPFDELQTRSYNILYANIGRHPNLTPWPGQEGSYTRYVNALIGNNGATNIGGELDSIQGSLIRRETVRLGWGVSGAFLSGNSGSADSSPTATFSDVDDASGIDLRGAGSYLLGRSVVLGAGLRLINASSEVTDRSFEDGVGGFLGTETLDQQDIRVDVGVRHYFGSAQSWEAQLIYGTGTFEQQEASEILDDGGFMSDSLVISNYNVDDSYIGLFAGYNRLKTAALGETEFRVGFESSNRELSDPALSWSMSGGVVTPEVTLTDQDPLSTTRFSGSAKTVFQAGQTELFAGAEIAQSTLQGLTMTDAAGFLISETIDDSQLRLGGILGLRQPLWQDKLRFVVTGRGDYFNIETNTDFETSRDNESSSRTITQYALGLEGVLANVTFDLAWLFSEEAPIDPGDIGLPSGTRRNVSLDRLVVSAAVSW